MLKGLEEEGNKDGDRNEDDNEDKEGEEDDGKVTAKPAIGPTWPLTEEVCLFPET